MSRNQSTLWEAPPHTLAKIELLRGCLHAWFPILGCQCRNCDLWYLDGFAGPGEYLNSPDGSPIAALQAATAALQDATRWTAGQIRCVFMEEDEKRFRNLQSRLQRFEAPSRISVEPMLGTFTEGLNSLKQRADNPFRASCPLFAFIDPFGPKGLSFSEVANLLNRPRSEVLLHLDSDGIKRIYRGGEAANH